MIATINWVLVEWTPSEIIEFRKLSEKEKFTEVITEASTPHRTVVPSCWPGSRWGWRKWGANNKFWPGWQKVWTISMINWQKIEYANQSVCAKAIWVNQTVVSKKKDTGRPVNGYYITTKHP